MESNNANNPAHGALCRAHRDCNHSTRTHWDGENIHDIGLVEDVAHYVQDEHEIFLNVQFAVHKSRIPLVATREFVYLEWSWKKPCAVNPKDHEWIILASHTEHPKRPERPDLMVRALQRTIMVLEPLAPVQDEALGDIPRTSVTLVAWVDPGGSISDTVVKWYKTILADRIAMLRTVYFV